MPASYGHYGPKDPDPDPLHLHWGFGLNGMIPTKKPSTFPGKTSIRTQENTDPTPQLPTSFRFITMIPAAKSGAPQSLDRCFKTGDDRLKKKHAVDFLGSPDVYNVRPPSYKLVYKPQ